MLAHDMEWTDAEKAIARKAFDRALKAECAAMIAAVREMSGAARTFDELWAIRDYLTKQRREIDEKYDYRYSQLIFVFGRLLREERISRADLDGLAQEKIDRILLLCSH
ncbi:MAG TPA: hypothetical protein VJ001_15145 [Rhodocyclaceae bacterium]|nr:hypothetical protein [Rhodocyclaceae bacterium]